MIGPIPFSSFFAFIVGKNRLGSPPGVVDSADQFSILRSTGILPVAGKRGQDARATPNAVAQFEERIGPEVVKNSCGQIADGSLIWWRLD